MAINIIGTHWGSEKKFLQFDHVNVRYNEKGLPIPKTMWRLDPVKKLFKVHSLIHNSLICHKFLFRKLSAFLHFIFISADLAAFGCCLKQAVVFQNHFQNWITFFAHFRPLNTYIIFCGMQTYIALQWLGEKLISS